MPGVRGAVKRAVDARPDPGRFLVTGPVRAGLEGELWPGTGSCPDLRHRWRGAGGHNDVRDGEERGGTDRKHGRRGTAGDEIREPRQRSPAAPPTPRRGQRTEPLPGPARRLKVAHASTPRRRHAGSATSERSTLSPARSPPATMATTRRASVTMRPCAFGSLGPRRRRRGRSRRRGAPSSRSWCPSPPAARTRGRRLRRVMPPRRHRRRPQPRF